MKRFILAIVLVASAQMAWADVDPGATLMISRMDYERNGGTMTPTTLMAGLDLGLSRNISIEARAGKDLVDGSNNFNGLPVILDVESIFGLYGKLRPSLDSPFVPYLLLGYTDTSVNVQAVGYSFSVSDSGFAYGAGIEIGTGAFRITAEYAKYLDGNDLTMKGFNLGARLGF